MVTIPVKYADEAEKYITEGGYTEVQVVPLDAIVIRCEDLPEVKPLRGGGHTAGTATRSFGSAEDYMQYALSALAIAVHLREHPPVDEAQVQALSGVLEEVATLLKAEYRPEVARRLAERGVRVEVSK
ncbi:hypothetical protein DNL40_02540 [Xylanimonas oleitrophica]|uniref:Uncharacterized protein n=1 Tax=Xylanimonas oleitrophica TaxID=2607479 RepID=A0A2W5XX44_9MICO|nr:hypothetical protein DNL40_02540 [Xylanimonas oleitrophica]